MRRARRVNPNQDRSAYKQVADDIRAQIADGDLVPGESLPGEERLGREYGVGVNTVRSALELLRQESLIVTERAVGSRVRVPGEPVVVVFPSTAHGQIRVATDEERLQLALRPGGLVLEVVDGADVRVVPALGAMLEGPDAHSSAE